MDMDMDMDMDMNIFGRTSLSQSFFGVSQLFGVSAGSRPWLKMHLQSEKVTSTCSQRFAELDPYCPSMLEAASESFRAGADASRLSLEVLRRLSSKLGALCRQSLRGTPTIKPMVLKVQT